MPDYAARRRMMVDTQVRPSDVTKFPIIEAMLRIPRERFVPDALREAAYVGETLQIATGRVLLDPRTLAKMLDALDIRQTDLVLDVACGTGYSTAVIARLAEAVVGVESDEALVVDAQSALADVAADNAVVQLGALEQGSAVHGPFDAIVMQGGIEAFPDTRAEQLKDGGRVAAVFMEGALGVVRLGVRRDDRIVWRDIFNAAVPVLDGFTRPRSFVL